MAAYALCRSRYGGTLFFWAGLTSPSGLVCSLLTVLGFLPGHVHAFYLICA